MIAVGLAAGAVALLAVNEMSGGNPETSPDNMPGDATVQWRIKRDMQLQQQNGGFSRSAHGLGDPNVRTNYANLRSASGNPGAVKPLLDAMTVASQQANQYTWAMRRTQGAAVSQYASTTKPCSREYLFPSQRVAGDPFARVTYPEGVPVVVRPYYKTSGPIPSGPTSWLLSQWNPGNAHNGLNRYREVPRSENDDGPSAIPASTDSMKQAIPMRGLPAKFAKTKRKVRFQRAL